MSVFVMATRKPTKAKVDLHQKVTDKILEHLENGYSPLSMQWDSPASGMPVRENGQSYRGINVLILWGAAMGAGYRSPMWMTYREAKSLGGQVRKDECGETVVYASTFSKDATGKDGNIEKKTGCFLKSYCVFNVDQIDELPAQYYDNDASEFIRGDGKRIAHADVFFENTGVVIKPDNGPTYYPNADYVGMPNIADYTSSEAYYSNLAHELTHWTKHESRLDRDFGRKKIYDAGYHFEELVAELGSAFLLTKLGIIYDLGRNAAYLAGYIRMLKEDNQAIFKAANYASTAVEYLWSLQPEIREFTQEEKHEE